MKRTSCVIATIVCSISWHSLLSQDVKLSTSEKHAIRAFINDIQYGRKELVAAAVYYPIERLYPLKPINNADEFLEHYDEFIDTPFTESVKSSEWGRVGWRGICCGSGILWGDINDNGEFYVYSYNNITQRGHYVWEEAVEKQRGMLYQGLRVFEEPVLMFKTIKFIIRIDLMPDNTYRYASWSQGHDISSKPDLIIMDGVLNVEGSLHLRYYVFKNGDYEYEIGPGNNSAGFDFELVVSNKGKELMRQFGNMLY